MNENTNQETMMKMKIDKVLAAPVARNIPREGQEPLKLTTVKVSGTVDGERHEIMQAKAWNGDAALIVDGAELYAKVDDKRRDGEPPSFMIGEIKAPAKNGQRFGGPRSGMSDMQFIVLRRSDLLKCATDNAVEMCRKANGEVDIKKVRPTAEIVFKFLLEKSLLPIEENRVIGKVVSK